MRLGLTKSAVALAVLACAGGGVALLLGSPFGCATSRPSAVAAPTSRPTASATTSSDPPAAPALADGEEALRDLGYAVRGRQRLVLEASDGSASAHLSQSLPRGPGAAACLRIAVAASAPVIASLVVGELPRGDFEGRAGLVGVAGPVCVRGAEPVRLELRGPVGTVVQYAWSEPAR